VVVSSTCNDLTPFYCSIINNFQFFRHLFHYRFLIGLSPLIYVAFTPLGGIDTVWQESVDLLQANNIRATNATDSSECEFLRETVEDWVASVGFAAGRRGVHLHLLHFKIAPVRCDILNKTQICSLICDPHKEMLNCDACDHVLEHSEGWYEDKFHRPNNIYSVNSTEKQMNYISENGIVVEANFTVQAQFNEAASVQKT